MLVLTRKISESIQIGDDIVIKVIRTGKTTVKIGIEAPSSVRVLRAELCEELAAAVPMVTKDETEDDAEAVMVAKALDAHMSQPAMAMSDQYPHVA